MPASQDADEQAPNDASKIIAPKLTPDGPSQTEWESSSDNQSLNFDKGYYSEEENLPQAMSGPNVGNISETPLGAKSMCN